MKNRRRFFFAFEAVATLPDFVWFTWGIYLCPIAAKMLRNALRWLVSADSDNT